MQDAENLYHKIKTIHPKQNALLIGIDGQGAAGKTTLAENLQKFDPSIDIISMDDFYLPKPDRPKGNAFTKPIGGDFDWQRLEQEVLKPLSSNKEVTYQICHWNSDTILSETKTVSPTGIIIIEGIYAIRPELKDYYDYMIWIDTPQDLRLQRGIARNGIQTKNLWLHEWMPHEDRYVKIYKPYAYADEVITMHESKI